VEVEFMEVEGETEVPGTRFSVMRVVHQTGGSNYHINGRGSSLEEVSTLLQSKGIDLTNNRFLILQGEVE
jgi:structural maintenance of chromosome 4